MGDKGTFAKIVQAKDPAACKSLGRQVTPFNGELWEKHLKDTALTVVQQKFASDPRLKEVLLSTGDAIICEATRNDKIWGIGIDVGDPRVNNIKQWQGRNVLGEALMEARASLRNQNDGDGDGFDNSSAAVDGVIDLTKADQEPRDASADQPARSRWKRHQKPIE